MDGIRTAKLKSYRSSYILPFPKVMKVINERVILHSQGMAEISVTVKAREIQLRLFVSPGY